MRVQDLFHQEQIPFLVGEEIFSSGAELRPRGWKKFLPSLKKILPLGHNRLLYYNITKESLLLASAPYAPKETFFHQGQKHTISNLIGAYLEGEHIPHLIFFIRVIYPLYPTGRHASAHFSCVGKGAVVISDIG